MATTTLTPDARIPFPSAFNRLATSNLAAQLAEQIALAAAPIIAVIVLGAGAGETGLLQAAQRLPFLMLAIPAGLLADRSSRKTLMAVAETLRLGTLLSILILAHLDLLTMPLLALFGFVGATGTVAYSVATPSLIPALVSRDQLGPANGRIELARSAAFVSGPALSGLLIGWLGASPTFTVAAVLSGTAAVTLFRIAEPARERVAQRRPIDDLKEGARFVIHHELLRPILFTAVFFNIAFFVLQAIYVPYAHDHLGLSAAQIGITLSLQGAGMVIGALVAGRVMQVLPFGWVIRIGPFMGLASSVLMLATWWIESLPLVGASFFVIGVGPMIWTISSTTLRQVITPDRMLGRVSALIATATTGATPVGAALGALIGSRVSLLACLVVALIGFAIQATIIATSAASRLNSISDAE
jgi:predicted MFS family arabinose efflux permease